MSLTTSDTGKNLEENWSCQLQNSFINTRDLNTHSNADKNSYFLLITPMFSFHLLCFARYQIFSLKVDLFSHPYFILKFITYFQVLLLL